MRQRWWVFFYRVSIVMLLSLTTLEAQKASKIGTLLTVLFTILGAYCALISTAPDEEDK